MSTSANTAQAIEASRLAPPCLPPAGRLLDRQPCILGHAAHPRPSVGTLYPSPTVIADSPITISRELRCSNRSPTRSRHEHHRSKRIVSIADHQTPRFFECGARVGL